MLPTPESSRVFHHTGDLGDIIYSFPTILAMGGGTLIISPDNRSRQPTRVTPSPETVLNLAPMAKMQPYIRDCRWSESMPETVTCDLNMFRNQDGGVGRRNSGNIMRHHLKAFGVDYPEDKPWLTVDWTVGIAARPIVVARSPRCQNSAFPWERLVTEHGQRMTFVGYPEEYEDFCENFGHIAYIPTTNLLELARVIAGGSLCIMNQSTPCAVAFGLGKNLIQETWDYDANCKLNRPNARYVVDGNVEIPHNWL